MKTITLNGQAYRLDATPSSFSWTPEMSAIWPAEYRPTMSGLLAIWDAMHDAAEYADVSLAAAAVDAQRAINEIKSRAPRYYTDEEFGWITRGPAPSDVVDADGWIAHRAGDPMPWDGKVKYKLSDGYEAVAEGKDLDWRVAHEGWSITHWKPEK